MSRQTIALAAVLAAHLAWTTPAFAQNTEAAFRTTTLNLTAQGEVRAKPDIVTISMGVTSEAATAQAATSATMGKVNAVVAAMKRAGVAQRDIQTQHINLTPKYLDRSNVPREIIAHQATATLTIVARDMDRAGLLLDTAIAAGANQVQGVRFGLADPAPVQREARDQALKSLQEDASQVAAIMGQRVVRLVSVSTQAYSGGGAQRSVEEVVVTGSRIEPGELVVRGHASGVFEIAPR